MRNAALLVPLMSVTVLITPALLQKADSPAGVKPSVVKNQAPRQKEMLGRMLFFDKNLSTPPGQSCASCHDPAVGFAEPDRELPVSEGVIPGRFGNRNCPTSGYLARLPDFHFDEETGLWVGGQFWDGRGKDLVEQAKGPFLNPLEMNNPDKATVVEKVARSPYAGLFRRVYGPKAFDDVEAAYHNIADAIATFEKSSACNRFDSRYDRYLRGQGKLTEQEMRGLALFEGKAMCSACHPAQGDEAGPALFTDFTYDNVGTPRNPNNPFYTLAPEWNPDGANWVDVGLMGTTGNPLDKGKMKVPTLRNIALSGPYMHNGVFQTLTEVVKFYNSRDVPGAGWPAPEVAENVNVTELGDLGLSDQEVADIVAFLQTLTDHPTGSMGWQGKTLPPCGNPSSTGRRGG